eukprot:3940361-Rhodomonas_salina.3
MDREVGWAGRRRERELGGGLRREQERRERELGGGWRREQGLFWGGRRRYLELGGRHRRERELGGGLRMERELGGGGSESWAGLQGGLERWLPSSRASLRTGARSSSLTHALATPQLSGKPLLSPSLPPLHDLICLLAPSQFGPSYSPVPSQMPRNTSLPSLLHSPSLSSSRSEPGLYSPSLHCHNLSDKKREVRVTVSVLEHTGHLGLSHAVVRPVSSVTTDPVYRGRVWGQCPSLGGLCFQEGHHGCFITNGDSASSVQRHHDSPLKSR